MNMEEYRKRRKECEKLMEIQFETELMLRLSEKAIQILKSESFKETITKIRNRKRQQDNARV